MAGSRNTDKAGENAPIYSVAEVSQALKRVVEDGFGWVRIRGEISGFKRAASGHLYFALKDENAVLDAVCWRGTAGRLGLAPEDGMEVIASGGLTTYPGRSRYQIVVQALELAGEGALLKLLEERKRKLAAEGLFDAETKRDLPYLPRVIGVVTSPTGAVIRDILHRLADRFPTRVLVWPVLVQGDGAADQVANAIRGFNALDPAGAVPRPDLLIVARGGGSLEDLWAFNEEAVVRAAAESGIPLISAVGHETDVTLIDLAADRRAPTPTAAAEMAVPVRAELMEALADRERRLAGAMRRQVEHQRTRLTGLVRGLPDARSLLATATQALDDRAEGLAREMRRLLSDRSQLLTRPLPHPRGVMNLKTERFQGWAARLARQHPGAAITENAASLEASGAALAGALRTGIADRRKDVERSGRLLESLSYRGVLARGFAVVRDAERRPLAAAAAVTPGAAMTLEFHDGEVAARADDGAGAPSAAMPAVTPAATPADDRPQRPKKAKKKPPPDDAQGSLL